MYSPFSEHVMFRTWIREIIQLDVFLDAFLYKTEAVLPDNCVVDGSLTDEQFAF